MEGKWSTLTKEEQVKNEIYQKGYEDGRKCMALHIKRMQKKIDKFESEKLKGILGSGLND
jgi:hypothetical protein|tara:strand:- start:29 stop:208 length:180 start_codon:yes stop_codon:yes gene_type:complete